MRARPTARLVCLAALFLCAATTSVAPAQRSRQSMPSDRNWPTYNRTYSGERFSPLRELTTANVSRLRSVCTYDTGERLSFQTGPLAVDGTLYFTTDTTTYAIDGATCALKWKHRHLHPVTELRANRGAAHENGRLFRGGGSKSVVALDASTGSTLWDIELGGLAPGTTVPMAPLAWKGLVFVGNAGGDEYGVTGHVYALNQKDGHTVWRFDVVPDTGPVRATWRNPDTSVPPTGGAFWTAFALDTARGTLFVPAGNPAPDFLPDFRPGENLYTNSVIGLDAMSGHLVGYIQLIDRDFHDWDVSAGPVLITTRGGRSLVISANKDGLLSAIDRVAARRSVAASNESRRENPAMASDALRTLALRYQTATTTRENMDVRMHVSSAIRFCPGSQGGSEWNGPSYHPGLNLLVVGAVDWCTSLLLMHPDSLMAKPGAPWTGAVGQPFGLQDSTTKWQGWLSAIDADDGSVRWKRRTPMPMLAGVTTTAGGIVLTGELTGDAIALDVKTGKVLWRGKTNNAIGGGVITYEHHGHQLVAVASGMNSSLWPVKAQSARLVIYGIP